MPRSRTRSRATTRPGGVGRLHEAGRARRSSTLRRALVNTHPALLPAFPGTHGAATRSPHGVKVTGCTVFVVDHGVDTGPIIAQRAVDVVDDDTDDEPARADQGAPSARCSSTASARMARLGWHVTDRKVTIG